MNTEKLLDMLASLRIRDKLESILHNDKDYQDALGKLDIAYNAFCAYRLGLQDGVKLLTELQNLESSQ